MADVRRVVSLLKSRTGSIRPGVAADDALLELMVHMASSDGVFDDAEVEMLEAVLPEWTPTQVRAFIGRVLGTPLDLPSLVAAFETEDARWTALRFAARMAHKDEILDEAERNFLLQLEAALALPDGALERALNETAPLPPDLLEPDALRELVKRYPWSSVDFVDGAVMSRDLQTVVPDEARPILRVGVDGAEVMGLYAEGLVMRFLEGAAYLPWGSIVGFSRGTGLASAVVIHTEDGRTWTIVDSRMSGVERLIERLHRQAVRFRAARPAHALGSLSPADTWDGDL